MLLRAESPYQSLSGHRALAEVDRDPALVVVEDGYQFQAGTEGFEILAQGGHPDVFGVLEFRDRSLGDVETTCQFDLADRLTVTKEVVPPGVEVEGWWSPSGRCRSGIVRRSSTTT